MWLPRKLTERAPMSPSKSPTRPPPDSDLVDAAGVGAIIHETAEQVLARDRHRRTRPVQQGRRHKDIPPTVAEGEDGSLYWARYAIMVWAVRDGLITEDGHRLIGYPEIAEMLGYQPSGIVKLVAEKNRAQRARGIRDDTGLIGDPRWDDFPEPDLVLGGGRRTEPRHSEDTIRDWAVRVGKLAADRVTPQRRTRQGGRQK